MHRHGTHKVWTAARAATALAAATLAPLAHGEVISGEVTNWAGWDSGRAPSDSLLTFGDGVDHVSAAWTFATYNQDWDPEAPRFSAWFYALDSAFTAPFNGVDVAWAEGVTDVAQITDASSFDFLSSFDFTGHAHRFADAQSNDGTPGSTHGAGVGDFVVLRNTLSGHYGVLRVNLIHSLVDDGRLFAHMDATWWFQTDRTGDFSSVPAPGAVLLGAFGAGVALVRRRR